MTTMWIIPRWLVLTAAAALAGFGIGLLLVGPRLYFGRNEHGFFFLTLIQRSSGSWASALGGVVALIIAAALSILLFFTRKGD